MRRRAWVHPRRRCFRPADEFAKYTRTFVVQTLNVRRPQICQSATESNGHVVMGLIRSTRQASGAVTTLQWFPPDVCCTDGVLQSRGEERTGGGVEESASQGPPSFYSQSQVTRCPCANTNFTPQQHILSGSDSGLLLACQS